MSQQTQSLVPPSPSSPGLAPSAASTSRPASIAAVRARGNAAAAASLASVQAPTPSASIQAWLAQPDDPALRADVAALPAAALGALGPDTLRALLDAALPPGTALTLRVARGLGVELAVAEEGEAVLARPTPESLTLTIDGSVGISAGVAEGLLASDAHGRPIAGQLVCAGTSFSVHTTEALEADANAAGLGALLAGGLPVLSLVGPGASTVLAPALAAALPGRWSHAVALGQAAAASATEVLDVDRAAELDEAGEDDPGWLGRALRALLPDLVTWGASAELATTWAAGPAGNTVTFAGTLAALLDARWESLPFVPGVLNGPAAAAGLPSADDLHPRWDVEAQASCTVRLDSGAVTLTVQEDEWTYGSLGAFWAALRGAGAGVGGAHTALAADAPDPLPTSPGWTTLVRALGLAPGALSGAIEAETELQLHASGAALAVVPAAPSAPEALRAMAAQQFGAPLPDWAAGMEATLARASALAQSPPLATVVARGTARVGAGGTVDGGALLPLTGTAAVAAGQTAEVVLTGAEAQRAARMALGGAA
jgi:hypothetical protein